MELLAAPTAAHAEGPAASTFVLHGYLSEFWYEGDPGVVPSNTTSVSLYTWGGWIGSDGTVRSVECEWIGTGIWEGALTGLGSLAGGCNERYPGGPLVDTPLCTFVRSPATLTLTCPSGSIPASVQAVQAEFAVQPSVEAVLGDPLITSVEGGGTFVAPGAS